MMLGKRIRSFLLMAIAPVQFKAAEAGKGTYAVDGPTPYMAVDDRPKEIVFSENFACPEHGAVMEELSPRSVFI